MNILFYSTSSNLYDGENAAAVTFPQWSEQWQNTALKYPQHKITIATQLPGMFLLDLKKNEISSRAKNVHYEIIEDDDEDKIADFLADLKPELAVAVSFYVAPFDWLSIKDGIIAEKLRSKGIKTICHPAETSFLCFDKWQTHQKLKELGINCAKAVYFHHELFMNGGNRREIKSNVYKTYFFNEIKKLHYPVIIKDCTGLSSYGMDVVNSFEEAKGIILSKKTSSDRIIEELIPGLQAGCEIISGKKITILPPFLFSVNRYGITSPKQSVKAGPAKKVPQIQELNEMLTRLSEKLKFNGIAQADLVYNEQEKKWYVIEINTRLSGMSTTYASSLNRSVSDILMTLATDEDFSELFDMNYALNIKFPILTEDEMKKAISISFVKLVNQLENLSAKQLREVGYAEMIITGKTPEELDKNLLKLKDEFPDKIEEIFVENAKKLLSEL